MTDPSHRDPGQTDEFYKALGLALSRWQNIEAGLYAIAFLLFRTDHQAASIVFFHIQSAVGKVSLVDKLCKLRLAQQQYQDGWVPLRKELSPLISARNAMAHFEVRHVTPPYPEWLIGLPKIVMMPHEMDTGAERPPLSVATLRDASEAFIDTAVKLIAFGCGCAPDW